MPSQLTSAINNTSDLNIPECRIEYQRLMLLAGLILEKLILCGLMNQMRKVPQQAGSKDAEQPLANLARRDPHSPFLVINSYRGIEFDRLCLASQHAIQEGRVYQKEIQGKVRLGFDHYTNDGRGGGFVELSASVSYSVVIEPGSAVLDFARVFVYATVKGNSIVCGSAKVHGMAILDNTSLVTDKAEVCDDARISNSTVRGESKIHGNARVIDTQIHDRTVGTGVIVG